jgi:hypothetical protein
MIRVGNYFKETYHCRRENELVERMTRPQEAMLEAATCRRLLILITGLVRLESGHPRGAGEVGDPHATLLELR